jgi:hypothetical protein
MTIFRRLAAVRRAQQRVAVARSEWDGAATVLLARSVAHPLTTVGVATGAGAVLGGLHVRPLRVPGLGALLSGGVADTVAFVMRLFVEFGVAGLRAGERTATDDHPDADMPADSTSP